MGRRSKEAPKGGADDDGDVLKGGRTEATKAQYNKSKDKKKDKKKKSKDKDKRSKKEKDGANDGNVAKNVGKADNVKVEVTKEKGKKIVDKKVRKEAVSVVEKKEKRKKTEKKESSGKKSKKEKTSKSMAASPGARVGLGPEGHGSPSGGTLGSVRQQEGGNSGKVGKEVKRLLKEKKKQTTDGDASGRAVVSEETHATPHESGAANGHGHDAEKDATRSDEYTAIPSSKKDGKKKKSKTKDKGDGSSKKGKEKRANGTKHAGENDDASGRAAAAMPTSSRDDVAMPMWARSTSSDRGSGSPRTPRSRDSPYGSERRGTGHESRSHSPFRRVTGTRADIRNRAVLDNSYAGTSTNSFGDKAHEALGQLRGKSFRKEKMKKKRQTYWGKIDESVTSEILFSDASD